MRNGILVKMKQTKSLFEWSNIPNISHNNKKQSLFLTYWWAAFFLNTLYASFVMTSLYKPPMRLHKATVFPTGFRANFALFVLNYWLRKFLLFAVANGFQLRCKSRAADAIVLQNLPLLAPSFFS